jgi:hypothetical protein
MGEAIGQSLPLAVGVALSAGAIILEVLLLLTPRGRITGPAFLAGRACGIAVVGAILLVLAAPANASDKGQPATWVDWLKLVLGVVLVAVAIQQWLSRPAAGEDVPTPKWMSAIDRFTPVKAAGSAIALTFINLKNLLLMIGAATAVAQTGVSGGKQAAAWMFFTVVASSGVAVPVGIYFAMGSRADEILETLKLWMARNNGVIMAVVSILLGVNMVGDGISGFAG